MPISLDPNLPQLNPINLHARLPQILHHTSIVRDMRTRLTCQRQIRYFGDLGQFPRWFGLKDTGPPRRCIRLIIHKFKILGGAGGRIVSDARVCKSPGAVFGSADGAGGVAGVGLEGDVAGFVVYVCGDEVGALVAEEDWVQGADGVADQIGAAD